MKLNQLLLLFGRSRKSLLPLLFLMELSAVVQAQDIGFRGGPNRDWKVEVSGTTGTTIVVGYKINTSRTETFRGVVPTNFTVRACSNLYCAVKNVGSTAAPLGLQVDEASLPSIFDKSSSPRMLYPPYYGLTVQVETHDGGWGGGPRSTLSPTDWPETLPPGMTRSQATEHDFTKELHEAQVRAFESMVGKGQASVWQLLWLAQAHQALTNRAGVEAAYAKLFKAECKDAMFLNRIAYDYVENGGTNLNGAYEAALKAQKVGPLDRSNWSYIEPFVGDTVGWILVKRGYYEQGLAILESLGKLREYQGEIGAEFHRAITHYMLMDESLAQAALLKVVQAANFDLPEKAEARECLDVLGIKEHTPQSNLVAKLKARLTKVPDDPVALNRLAAMYGQTDKVTHDAVVTKALGFEAYRQGEYAGAVRYLTESVKDRPGDGELCFRLGMAYHRLGNQDAASQWLRKATSSNLKDANVEEAKRVLGSPTL